MAVYGVDDLATAEKLFTYVATKTPLTSIPTTPINLQYLALGFYLFGYDSPAKIEQVQQFFSTHTTAELIALNPTP